MRASRVMLLSYLGMVGVPILLWLIAIMSPLNQTATAREVLASSQPLEQSCLAWWVYVTPMFMGVETCFERVQNG